MQIKAIEIDNLPPFWGLVRGHHVKLLDNTLALLQLRDGLLPAFGVIYGLGLRVSGFGFSSSGFRVSGFGLSCLGFRVSGFRG